MARAARLELSADAKEFTALFGKTSNVDAKLRAALKRRMRAAADKAALEVQAEVLKAPVTPGKRSRSSDHRRASLRAGIAGGVKVQIATGTTKVGVFIRATGSHLPPDQRVLVRAYNRRGGWRHPVFDRTARSGLLRRKRAVWVNQTGRPYFESVIEKQRSALDAAVRDAMAEATDSLR